jgi:iron complex transport system permease protein
VSVGEMAIPLRTALAVLGNGLFDLGFPTSAIQKGVIFDYRLSRALMAALCGGALAISGAILQALLRNPLAEPYILGVSAGASTGAVCVMILGFGGTILGLSGGAFVGSVAALMLVALLAAGSGGASDRVILAGVAGSQLFNAATSAIVTTVI